jgi:hypothetical protein
MKFTEHCRRLGVSVVDLRRKHGVSDAKPLQMEGHGNPLQADTGTVRVLFGGGGALSSALAAAKAR